MENLEIYSVSNLESFDLINIDGGGDPVEGSYGFGYSIGKAIRELAFAEIWAVSVVYDTFFR